MLFPRYVVESHLKGTSQARQNWRIEKWFDDPQDAIEFAIDEREFHPDKEWRVRDTREQTIVKSTGLDMAA